MIKINLLEKMPPGHKPKTEGILIDSLFDLVILGLAVMAVVAIIHLSSLMTMQFLAGFAALFAVWACLFLRRKWKYENQHRPR